MNKHKNRHKYDWTSTTKATDNFGWTKRYYRKIEQIPIKESKIKTITIYQKYFQNIILSYRCVKTGFSAITLVF